MLKRLFRYSQELLFGCRGGGKKETTTIIQPPAAPKPPSASEVAQEQAKAQLQYTPEMYEAYYKAQEKYAPRMAELGVGLQQQYAPLMQALYQQMYPQQGQVIESMAGRALERLAAPDYMTPGQRELDNNKPNIQQCNRQFPLCRYSIPRFSNHRFLIFISLLRQVQTPYIRLMLKGHKHNSHRYFINLNRLRLLGEWRGK